LTITKTNLLKGMSSRYLKRSLIEQIYVTFKEQMRNQFF